MFSEDAGFRTARFSSRAGFDGATFSDRARFAGVTFLGSAEFDRATFSGRARFDRATFSGAAGFYGALFSGDALFDRVTFSGRASFARATFSGSAQFPGTRFDRAANFSAASFRDADFQEVQMLEEVDFSGVTFGELARFSRAAFPKARFPSGGDQRVRWETVLLDDAVLPAPMIIASAPEAEAPCVWSVERTDVEGLTLAGVDITSCRFSFAHNLDKLRLEGWRLDRAPTRFIGRGRRVIAEEVEWRQTRGRGRWAPAKQITNPEQVNQTTLEPALIAGLYRALRKGQEDVKNEPGAADFYYGEMEMRRLAPQTPVGERVLLWLYWFFSGYALRAWRALTALLLVLALTTVLIFLFGFSPQKSPTTTVTVPTPAGTVTVVQSTPPAVHRSVGQATIDSVEGAVFRNPDPQLNLWGRGIQTGLRFVGPILLGLALLSIRGRVKR